MEPQFETLHGNFIKAARLIMAENDLATDTDFADWLNVSKQVFYGIKNNGRIPTVEQILTLCEKGGFNANWLMFNIGEPLLGDQNDIDKIMKEIKSLKTRINKVL